MFDSPLKIAGLMRGFKPDWFIAGGWAIDLFLGKETRPHEDIEIAVFRRDQLALQKHLSSWRLKQAVNGEYFEWKKNDFLKLPVHAVHCFNKTQEPNFLEVLFNETSGDEWIYRRNQKITRPIAKLFSTNETGIKFLRPEIVLLYKSKNPREKDEQDFQSVVKNLDAESRTWLKNALSLCDAEHYWLKTLSEL